VYVVVERRHRAGALAGAGLLVAAAVWLFASAMASASSAPSAIIFWSNIQTLGMYSLATLWLAYVSLFTGHDRLLSPTMIVLLTVAPLIAIALTFTNKTHNLMFDYDLVLQEGSVVTSQSYGPGAWAYVAYSYVQIIVADWFLIRTLLRRRRLMLFRLLVLTGTHATMVAANIINLAGLYTFAVVDPTVLAFIVGGPLTVWAMGKVRAGEIVPVARERIIEGMNDAVIVLDPDGRVMDMNIAARKLAQVGAEPVAGELLEQLWPRWPLFGRSPDGEGLGSDIMLETGDGLRCFDMSLSLLWDWRSRLVCQVYVLRDVTERMRTADELKSVNEELEQRVARRTAELEAAYERLKTVDGLRKKFAVNVSHELRTPLANLNLYLHLLTNSPDDPELYLSTLQRETKRLEHLVEDMLYLTNLDKREIPLSFAPVDLNALAAAYITDHQRLAAKRQLSLAFHEHPELPPVMVDEARLGRVLRILLTNALNYTPEGGRIDVKTDLQEVEGRSWSGFSVSDTGQGIPKDEQEQLFERFVRGNVGQDSGVPGTGLGLAIASDIVAQHRGKIEVKSEGIPGKGAKFSVWLPMSR
jgi:signal transduction histidine kinase